MSTRIIDPTQPERVIGDTVITEAIDEDMLAKYQHEVWAEAIGIQPFPDLVKKACMSYSLIHKAMTKRNRKHK